MYGYIEGGLTSAQSLTPITSTFTGTKDIALKLKKDVLSGGVYYKFKLTVTDVDDVSASSTYELKTNSVPSQGELICFEL